MAVKCSRTHNNNKIYPTGPIVASWSDATDSKERHYQTSVLCSFVRINMHDISVIYLCQNRLTKSDHTLQSISAAISHTRRLPGWQIVGLNSTKSQIRVPEDSVSKKECGRIKIDRNSQSYIPTSQTVEAGKLGELRFIGKTRLFSGII